MTPHLMHEKVSTPHGVNWLPLPGDWLRLSHTRNRCPPSLVPKQNTLVHGLCTTWEIGNSIKLSCSSSMMEPSCVSRPKHIGEKSETPGGVSVVKTDQRIVRIRRITRCGQRCIDGSLPHSRPSCPITRAISDAEKSLRRQRRKTERNPIPVFAHSFKLLRSSSGLTSNEIRRGPAGRKVRRERFRLLRAMFH